MSDDYECEDCLGMGPAHGCYCMANGAVRPGGPRADDPGEPLLGEVFAFAAVWFPEQWVGRGVRGQRIYVWVYPVKYLLRGPLL